MNIKENHHNHSESKSYLHFHPWSQSPSISSNSFQNLTEENVLIFTKIVYIFLEKKVLFLEKETFYFKK